MQIHQIMEWADTLCRALLKETETAGDREFFCRIKVKSWGWGPEEKEYFLLLTLTEKRSKGEIGLQSVRLTVLESEKILCKQELGTYKSLEEAVLDIENGGLRKRLLHIFSKIFRMEEEKSGQRESLQSSPESGSSENQYIQPLLEKGQ